MSVKLSEIESISRGMVIDKIEAGVDPLFSEPEVVQAINATKEDLWGMHPEAFITSGLSVSPPSDLVSTRSALLFTYRETSITLNGLAQALGDTMLADGIINMEFRSILPGVLIYFGDTFDQYFQCKVTADGIIVTINDTANVEYVTLTLAGSFLNDRYVPFTITADGVDLTIESGGLSATAAYSGDFLPYVSNAYIGYSNINTDELWFEGAVAEFSLLTSDSDDLHVLDFTGGSGYEITETSNGDDATIYGPTVTWLSDDDLAIAGWALRKFCYGVASMLLLQRGKDSFYRKAADALMKLYLG